MPYRFAAQLSTYADAILLRRPILQEHCLCQALGEYAYPGQSVEDQLKKNTSVILDIFRANHF